MSSPIALMAPCAGSLARGWRNSVIVFAEAWESVVFKAIAFTAPIATAWHFAGLI